MTREEFEYAIKSCGCFIYRGQTYYEESEMMKAFEDMGLIEQEQSGDLIQRQDDRGVSLKSVKHILYDVCLHEDNMALFSKLLDRVNKLRDWEEYLTIKQEPSGDAISRQAVLDIDFYRIIHTTANPSEMIRQKIEQLPSVNPQEPKKKKYDNRWFNGYAN